MKNSIVRKACCLLLILSLVFMNFTGAFAAIAAAESEVTAEELFISEYIEGSSYNKAIEVYNGTGSTVDLAEYQLALYSNGASTATQTITLTGTLEHGDVFVVAHSSADAAILAVSDMTNNAVVNFNGDDAISLNKNGEILDVVGEIGVRDNFGQDVTLVRIADVIAPNTIYNLSEWDNYASNTFAYLGGHIMDGANHPGEPGDPESDMYAIEEARSLPDGTTVQIEGIITADNRALSIGSQFSTYIQDDTAGINLFAYTQGELPDVVKGDKVIVSGELASYKGLKEVVPASVEVVAKNQKLPEPQQITLEDLQNPQVAEGYEGQRVQLQGYINSVPESPAGGGYNVSVIDGDFNGTTLRVMENALDIAKIEEGFWYNLTAIVSQYDTYQLIPAEQADIVKSEEQPEPPSSAGYYEATVATITDGDTIRIQDPIFGETRIRFLNMDTAETYAAKNKDPNRTEINENQKYYGDLATEYISSLIQPGDEIYLKVGDEPTDDYGRILAEVIRKEDNLNINLEMVRAGYASTYFLAPIDEEAYPQYQESVKAAKDQKLGIWNAENPLLELPFAFRANDDQKGFLRYVGNSESMEYVVPDEWESVPVEKRIFFASEEEAESHGFSPAKTEEQPDEDLLEVQILSMNDLHGKIDQQYSLDPYNTGVSEMYGRMDYTTAAMKERQAENENTLIVHAGDMIGGSSPISGLLQDEPTVEIMEEIGFDVGTVGNHEFDEGLEELLRMVEGGEHPEEKGTEGYDGMDFPVLCANCVLDDTGEEFLPPYHIEEVDGVEIGFIGVNTVETVNMVMPASLEGVRFTDETEAVNEAAAELSAQGVEAIIVLAHMAATQTGQEATGAAANLAREVDDAVDVIFAAHNHAVVDAVVDNKLIVQASEYGKAFGDVDLVIDRNTGDIVEKEAEIVFVNQNEYTPDANVAAILEKYEHRIAPIINEVIGYNAQDLVGSYTNEGDHGLGNLIADGMNWAMDSDFAMMNGGGIRDSLLAGEITWGNLYNIQPFGNTLMTVEIKGADLYPIINEQLSSVYGPDYSISGLHYTWNPERSEAVDITFPDGTPIDPEATYILTVNNYMGTSEGPIKELGQNPTMGPVDVDATVDFIEHLNSSAENPIVYGSEGRITETDKLPGEEPEEPNYVDIEPKKNNGTATIHTKDLDRVQDGDHIRINIYNKKKPRDLLLNKKQVDILKAKNVILTVTDGEKSVTIDMINVKSKVLKVRL